MSRNEPRIGAPGPTWGGSAVVAAGQPASTASPRLAIGGGLQPASVKRRAAGFFIDQAVRPPEIIFAAELGQLRMVVI